MNPSIKPRHSGRFKSGALLIALLGGVAGLLAWWQRDQLAAAVPSVAPPPIPVVVTTVERRDVPHLTRAVGTVTSLHSVTLRSQVDGVLTAVHFVEGQMVEQGALLATIDDRAIAAARDQARAELARNVAQLRAARIDLERYSSLSGRAAVAAQIVDQQAALVAQLDAGIAANRAAIAAAEVELSHTRIVAPVTGRVGLRLIDPGNLVRAGDSSGLVTVTQLTPIAVIFSLPQELLPGLQARLEDATANMVRVRERALGSVLAEGRLALIDNAIDVATGTIKAKAEFANDEQRLWPGQFVSVELATGMSADALVIALPAVQRGIDHPYVYRVKDTTVEAVPITIDYEDDAIAVIRDGLAAGDVIVADGQSRLRPGAAVRIVAAADADGADDG